MRIGNGPQLQIPRLGRKTGRWGYAEWDGAHSYEELLAQRRAQVRRLPAATSGERKRITTQMRSVRAGQSYRLVDGHGREFGRRITALADGQRGDSTRVRLVDRQEEPLFSQLSRMMKAAHKQCVRPA